MEKHLWEVEHEYYMSDSVDWAKSYTSWPQFIADMGDCDKDMNLLFRWDWVKPEDNDTKTTVDEMQLFFVQQRRGMLAKVSVGVTYADEDAIIEWLKSRFEHMVKLWEPFTGEHAD